ncbi:glycoside hydrolase family 130 protein [Perlabentimonas gracilis]|uniref:glycoside hydrolase family 130 protein n=1 Tax=Perlabentimonas gracilis TaxID=2715279 RepID=UPI00140C3A16|nr:glycoside hydrolase family 130 protein [Perlabentimonas gracilis]NHB68817.1 glycosidase [Perlabentimonas gracilis]
MQVAVVRKDTHFTPDPSRVIARFLYTNDERSKKIIHSVLAMPEDEVRITMSQVLRGFAKRHRNISKIFEKHFNKLSHLFERMGINPNEVNQSQKVLIGSYFTMEYSIESAAFFNPSIVDDPDQSELLQGEKRVILSFRATGEGHISSIVFRSAVIDRHCDMIIEPVGKMLAEADRIERHIYDKTSFILTLDGMTDFDNKISPMFVFEKLGDKFTYGELSRAVKETKRTHQLTPEKESIINQIMWLALSHYEIDFSLDSAISERVIFPISETERNGIEDARFVKFTGDNGEVVYYATYTAYDGITILPKLLETKDFYHFKCIPIHGELAHNKGMALFPRKINGKYTMLCRLDGVNNYLAYSDNLSIWREAKLIQSPKYPWELVQVGNSGSPIETEEGWLVITHGVGPMREYALGASLYDLGNPEKEIGRLKTPLLAPNEEEREGYVPNVVYSCGSIVHNGNLVIPYAMSDYAATYATVNLKELLEELKRLND